MYRPRIIPVLLLKDLGLVKSKKFSNLRYIGDPINAVKIFNDLKADELVFLDIKANKEKRKISLDFVKKVGAEANMPFSVGGGIKSVDDIKEIINAGAEKVVLNTFAFLDSNLVKKASSEFGSSTIAVSIDVKKHFFYGKKVYIYSGKKVTKENPISYAQKLEELGAGEIILNSIDRDGCMDGYDIDIINKVSENVSIPVVASGGAGKLIDFNLAVEKGNASAVAAGSIFVYHGSRNAVLINYPSQEEILKLWKK
tara:strand:- start:8118 stop:8882 length:765 start_codon:yes stop_codon:yes gene_type:complete